MSLECWAAVLGAVFAVLDRFTDNPQAVARNQGFRVSAIRPRRSVSAPLALEGSKGTVTIVLSVEGVICPPGVDYPAVPDESGFRVSVTLS